LLARPERWRHLPHCRGRLPARHALASS
jgi:hypothetical protein